MEERSIFIDVTLSSRIPNSVQIQDISFLNKHDIICILVRNDEDAVKAARNRYEYFDDDESVDDI